MLNLMISASSTLASFHSKILSKAYLQLVA